MNKDIITLVKSKIEKIEQLQRDKAKQEGQREQMYKQLEEVSGTASIKLIPNVVAFNNFFSC